MAANLTPQYRKAEEKFRQAQTPQARIQCLELMLQVIPKHKGTDRLQGMLRNRLKEARAELMAEQSGSRAGKSYRIPRQGAGTVVIIGAPNAGKSRVLKELTGAAVEIAPYPFTTRAPQAGMMRWNDLHVQLIDTPPITRNFVEPYVTGFIRSADLVLLCIDGSEDDAVQETLDLLNELEQRKTRLSDRSGFDETDFGVVDVKTLCLFTRKNAPDAAERLDFLQQCWSTSHSQDSRVSQDTKNFNTANKTSRMMGISVPRADSLQVSPERFNASAAIPGTLLQVDLELVEDRERLRESIGSALPILRIYTRRPGDPAPDPVPIPLPAGATVEDLAMKIHDELAAGVKFAKVWNAGNQTGRTVQRDHPLQNLDLVELFL